MPHQHHYTVSNAVDYVKKLEDQLNWTLPGDVENMAALIEQNHELCIEEPDIPSTWHRTSHARYILEAKKLIKLNYGYPGVNQAQS